MSYIISDHYRSKNSNSRIHFLVLHYTALDFEHSLQALTAGAVSAHYLIPEDTGKQPTIYRLVDESLRAWHAGVSYWQGKTNLNDTSIGIEIVNLGYEDKEEKRHWFSFHEQQMATVIALAQDIVRRYQIAPTCIVGHSDIAPGRKMDPGPLFPWKTLAQQGVGAWYDEHAVRETLKLLPDKKIDIGSMQKNLSVYGYNVSETGQMDQPTANALQAFQMHFRPADYSGIADQETCAILANLVKKYFPASPL
jgi:N-acetylmuramoyl-L-alanine amidase